MATVRVKCTAVTCGMETWCLRFEGHGHDYKIVVACSLVQIYQLIFSEEPTASICKMDSVNSLKHWQNSTTFLPQFPADGILLSLRQ
jgi:hypothetical protein